LAEIQDDFRHWLGLVILGSGEFLTTIKYSRAEANLVSDFKKLGSRARIMVVDDAPEFVELIEVLLSDEYELLIFTDPTKAIERLAEESVNLILTDLNMPQIAGKDFIATIRARGFDLPIIIVTGHSENDVEVVEAMKAGGTIVLTKPFRDTNIISEKIGKLIKL
jgi:CheY-like chemotaxis protein